MQGGMGLLSKSRGTENTGWRLEITQKNLQTKRIKLCNRHCHIAILEYHWETISQIMMHGLLEENLPSFNSAELAQ
jgi:hypothetical protein